LLHPPQNPVVSTIDKFLGGSYNRANLSKSANIKMSNDAHRKGFVDNRILFVAKERKYLQEDEK
jgi:hypothetical protein